MNHRKSFRTLLNHTLVAGVLQAMGEKMLALEADFHATHEVLSLKVIKCVTTFVFTWLIHALVKPNLHEDSAMFEEGGFVVCCRVQTPEWAIFGRFFPCQYFGKCVALIFSCRLVPLSHPPVAVAQVH